VDVDHCPTCRGWWLDALELERITDLPAREIRTSDSGASVPRPTAAGPLPCPRCGGGQLIRLNSLERPGTILDSCTVCYGMWVDAGELAHVAHADTLAAALKSFFKRN
jgi:Zn-finger nucleic acid-binding protein